MTFFATMVGNNAYPHDTIRTAFRGSKAFILPNGYLPSISWIQKVQRTIYQLTLRHNPLKQNIMNRVAYPDAN